MDREKQAREISFFSEYVSEHKKSLFREVLASRTRFFTLVLEDIYQAQNTSAVLRSCDGFGIQDVHVVENRNRFEVDKGVTIGSDKWLTIHQYQKKNSNNTEIAFNLLRENGYRIVAASPGHKQISLPDFLPEQPTAIVFGAEKAGLSDYAMEHADDLLHIPMFGFSESFNISVCAAICLYHLRRILDASELPWQLTDDEKEEMYLQWLRNSVRHLPALDRKFLELYESQA